MARPNARERLRGLGYGIVLYANAALQGAVAGVQKALTVLRDAKRIDEDPALVTPLPSVNGWSASPSGMRWSVATRSEAVLVGAPPLFPIREHRNSNCKGLPGVFRFKLHSIATHIEGFEMKTSKIIAAAALSLVAAAGAHAETYEGVHQVVSANSRADVLAQAFATARAANQNVTNGSRVLASPASSVDRATVRAEAVAAAHAPNQNLDSKAFVNSVVPEQFNRARPVTQQAGL